MKKNRGILFCFLIFFLFIYLPSSSLAQLTPSETRILFQIQQFLEYPEPLQGWTNWTNFCTLPPTPSLIITCSGNHITELTVAGTLTGNSTYPEKGLSGRFSMDSFFTVLTKLSSLRVLSLVSLGLWGPLPPKISRLKSLEILNISSNFVAGEIPETISGMKSLKSLILSYNLFNGSVPDLKGLQNLQELDLGNNHLGPKFPSFGNNLVTINLRENYFRSELPPLIRFSHLLHRFDVSSNKLIGPIPVSLFSLPSIQFLNLGDNQFSGALPMNISCNTNLSFIDVSKNLLIGKLPVCMASQSRNRTVITSWNCLQSGGKDRYYQQHPFSFCQKKALAVKPPSIEEMKKKKKNSSMKIGMILGIIGGTVVAAVVFGVLVLVIVKKRESDVDKPYKCDSFVFEKGGSARASPLVDERRLPQNIRLPVLGLPPYRVFTLEEMEDATNNFDSANLVGDGSQGQLYKGWISDGSMVLIKCVKLKQKNSHQSLSQQHIEVISKLRHRHLVSVLGHCSVTYQDHPNTATTVFIVLELVSNGSLRDHLTDWKKKDYLKWPQRMGISIGIAKGVQFLHSGIAQGIFGNDLKIENVLLDDSLSAKLSSYNLSFPTKAGSESPLSENSTKNAEKNDIYQLGVILLEIITGKPIKSDSILEELKARMEQTLAESPANLKDEVDPTIHGTFAHDSVKTAMEITLKCLYKEPKERPTIEDVLWHLQYAIQVQEGWNTTSGNLNTR